jgi:transcriptional antiterminator NusG
MNYYALQVKTGDEELVKKRVEIALNKRDFCVILPTRTLRIRRGGKVREQCRPVFSGYIFLSGEDSPSQVYMALKRTEGFYRFLPSNTILKPLLGSDLAHLKHFMSFARRSDISKVSFDENERIIVHEGPLKGYEGMIVRVDRRKGRARIRIDFCRGPMTLDLSFDVLAKAEAGGGADDGRQTLGEDLRDRGGLRRQDDSPGDRA